LHNALVIISYVAFVQHKHIICFHFTAPMSWYMSYSSVKCISNNVSEIMRHLNKINNSWNSWLKPHYLSTTNYNSVRS